MKALASLVAVSTLSLAATVTQAANLTPTDYVEIEQLYARYNIALDSGDAEAWVATFTPDGTFNTSSGREGLLKFAKEWHEKRNGANRRHWNSNLRLMGTPEGAEGSVYLMLLDVSTRPASIALTGMYSDTLVKTADGWRFKKRQVKGDTPAPAAAAPATPTPPTGAKPQ
jgi:SnoaL-like domain